MTELFIDIDKVFDSVSTLRTQADRVDPGFSLFGLSGMLDRVYAADPLAPARLSGALEAVTDCRGRVATAARQQASRMQSAAIRTSIADIFGWGE